MQLVCNLRLGLALEGAAAGLSNDDLEDAGKRDPIQPSNPRWSSADQTAEPILNLLVPIGNQLLLRRKIVIERLLGDLRLARHVTDGNPFIAPLGEQPSGGVGDELPGAGLLALAQSDGDHARDSSKSWTSRYMCRAHD